MRITIKNKFASLRGSSVVEDENGDVLYRVKGRWAIFCPTRNKRIYDNKGNKVFVVKNKFWKFWTQKAFIKDCATGDRLATVKYGIWTTNGRYVIEGYKDEIEIVGKRWGLEREVLRNGESMAKVTSKFMSIVDNYTIDADDADIPFLVALLVAVDNIKDRESREKI